MKRRVFISAGHSDAPGKDNGATGIDGIKEGILTVDLRRLLIGELRLLNIHAISNSDALVLKDDVAMVNDILDVRDIALDIHFNWYNNNKVRGTEVLIPFKSSDFERSFAATLSKGIASILNTNNRGVKTEVQSAHGTLLFMRPNCENILIEVCFISNTLDLDSYKLNKQSVAKFIATSLLNVITI
jgi:N-acetylmuramoyl-L-alanine amidase